MSYELFDLKKGDKVPLFQLVSGAEVLVSVETIDSVMSNCIKIGRTRYSLKTGRRLGNYSRIHEVFCIRNVGQSRALELQKQVHERWAVEQKKIRENSAK